MHIPTQSSCSLPAESEERQARMMRCLRHRGAFHDLADSALQA
jgi:hypothetical protein